MLRSPKPLRDPLGHCVQLPSDLFRCGHDYNRVSQVITNPSFMIKVNNEKLCFFRLVTWKVNMLVEARLVPGGFIAIHCMENPTPEYISSLLKMGSLISFQ